MGNTMVCTDAYDLESYHFYQFY